MVFLVSALWAQQKEYLLQWRYEKGLTNVNQNVGKTQVQRFQLDKNSKPGKKAPDVQTITTKYLTLWQVAEIMDNKEEAVVTIYRKKGSVEVKRGYTTYTCEVENPSHAKKLEDPLFKDYLFQIRGGFAFLINFKTGSVKATWILKELAKKESKDKKVENVQYDREIAPTTDPFNMESSFKQLPNKVVPVGYTWDLERSYQAVSYKYHYKFSKIETFKSGWKAARVEISGEVIKGGKKIGDIKGYFFHSIDYGVMLQQSITDTQEETYPPTKVGGNDMPGLLVKTVRETQIDLVDTNAYTKK